MRMVLPHPGEKLAPWRPVQRLAGKDERNLLTRGRRPSQLRLRRRRRAGTDDAIAPLIAIEFALDRAQRALVAVDRE